MACDRAGTLFPFPLGCGVQHFPVINRLSDYTTSFIALLTGTDRFIARLCHWDGWRLLWGSHELLIMGQRVGNPVTPLVLHVPSHVHGLHGAALNIAALAWNDGSWQDSQLKARLSQASLDAQQLTWGNQSTEGRSLAHSVSCLTPHIICSGVFRPRQVSQTSHLLVSKVCEFSGIASYDTLSF